MEGDGNRRNLFPGSNYHHGESSNTNFDLNLEVGDDVSFQELLTAGEDWLTPLIEQARAAERSEQRHPEQNVAHDQAPRDQSSAGLGFSQFTGGPLAFQEASLGSVLPGGLDLNAPAGGCSSSYAGFLSSGSAEYVVEDHNQDSSADGRRLALKRREPEDAPEERPFGESSNSAQQGANYEQQLGIFQQLVAAANAQANARRINGIGPLNLSIISAESVGAPGNSGLVLALEVPSGVHPVEEAESSQRNIRFRRSFEAAQYFPLEGNYRSAAAAAAAVPGPFTATPGPQPVPQGFNFLLDLQATRLGAMQDMDRIRNMMNAPQFFPEFERGNQVQNMRTNLDFPGSGNIAPAPRNDPGTSSMYAPSSSRFPPPEPETLGDIINRSWHCCPYHEYHAAADRDVGPSMGADNGASSSQPPLRLGSMMRTAERQAAGPLFVQSPSAAERQQRTLSEVHDALHVFSREHTVHFEDFMVVDASMLNGLPGEESDDENDDMRLDVDNMTYEELLALEEQIGNVPTGLSDETILARLRRQIYQPVAAGPGECEPCCVCQEDFVEGEELGRLDCGHEYHFSCIKQWLNTKNTCPICKTTGLDV
ncbi:hypothetical protein SLEP1_g11871 [Rubroshorea leprosula]|nr:hypothetical protein SLEP1_g11871 [Rubroshorea leprosula]